MKVVCDASFFFGEYPLDGELCTTPEVLSELRDLGSKCRFDLLREQGLTIASPNPGSISRVKRAAASSGDLGVLSETDIGLLALADEINGVIATDDFAIQNVAAVLGVATRPILQRKAKKRQWKLVCTGCLREVESGSDCPVCGASLKRRNK